VRRTDEALARPIDTVPELPRGVGLVMVSNQRSGDPLYDPADDLAAALPEAVVLRVQPHLDLDAQLDAAVQERDGWVRAIGVAGGDGTVATAAAVAGRRGLPMVVVPTGTLNHFARDVGVEGLDDAARAVGAGDGVRVDLSAVRVDGGDRIWFVNTASLGGYPDMVRLREKLEKRWGKWPAAGIAMAKVLKSAQPLNMELNGEPHRVWMLFVGNGPYLPKGFAPTTRPKLDSGLMDVRYIRADTRYSRSRFFLGALLGSLHRSRTYRHLETRKLDVRVFGSDVAIATDGEVGPTGDRFEFRSHPAALAIYRP
jgi:undecaprenyl-diphosphatase